MLARDVIDTPMTHAFPDEVKARAAESHPLRQWGLAAEVEVVVAFVAWERASYINGARIDVNGGAFIG